MRRPTRMTGENRQIGYCANDFSLCPAVPGTGRTQYGYDGEGRRVSKTDESGTTLYVYDASGQLAAEYGGTVTATGTQYLAKHFGSEGSSSSSSEPAGKDKVDKIHR